MKARERRADEQTAGIRFRSFPSQRQFEAFGLRLRILAVGTPAVERSAFRMTGMPAAEQRVAFPGQRQSPQSGIFRIGKDGDQPPAEEWLEARGDDGPVRA